jgi:hypothetical protein
MPDPTSLTVFILGQVIVVPPAVIAKRMAAMLMGCNLYVPIALGLMAILLAWSIIRFMPFDVQEASTADVLTPDEQQEQDQVQDQEQDPEQMESDNRNAAVELTLFQILILQNKNSFKVLCLSHSIFFLTCTFWVTSIFGQLMIGTVFLQYIEKRLGYNMADVKPLRKSLSSSFSQRLI